MYQFHTLEQKYSEKYSEGNFFSSPKRFLIFSFPSCCPRDFPPLPSQNRWGNLFFHRRHHSTHVRKKERNSDWPERAISAGEEIKIKTKPRLLPRTKYVSFPPPNFFPGSQKGAKDLPLRFFRIFSRFEGEALFFFCCARKMHRTYAAVFCVESSVFECLPLGKRLKHRSIRRGRSCSSISLIQYCCTRARAKRCSEERVQLSIMDGWP